MDQSVTSLNLTTRKLEQLQKLGYNYCQDVPGEFGISNVVKAPKTESAFEIYNEELLQGCILSYNKNLDAILINEIVPKSIVELTGAPGSGKTQICMQLCVSVQLQKKLGCQALYITTNRNVSPERLKEIANEFVKKHNNYGSFSVEIIMKNIFMLTVIDCTELIASVKYLESFLPNKQVVLIIIDSITCPIRLLDPEKRRNIILQIFQELKILSHQYNFSTVITNDLTTRTSNGENTPSLGDSYYHCLNTRIWLSRKTPKLFNAKLIKSVVCGMKEIDFYL